MVKAIVNFSIRGAFFVGFLTLIAVGGGKWLGL